MKLLKPFEFEITNFAQGPIVNFESEVIPESNKSPYELEDILIEVTNSIEDLYNLLSRVDTHHSLSQGIVTYQKQIGGNTIEITQHELNGEIYNKAAGCMLPRYFATILESHPNHAIFKNRVRFAPSLDYTFGQLIETVRQHHIQSYQIDFAQMAGFDEIVIESGSQLMKLASFPQASTPKFKSYYPLKLIKNSKPKPNENKQKQVKLKKIK